jgi:hypothetical protein
MVQPSRFILKVACDDQVISIDAEFDGIAGVQLTSEAEWQITDPTVPRNVYKPLVGRPVKVTTFRAELSPRNPRRLIIRPPEFRSYTPPLTIAIEGKTEIGEAVTSTVTTDYRTCDPAGFFEDLLRGEMLLKRLGGKLPPTPGPDPDPVPLDPLPQLDQLVRRYDGDARAMVEAHAEFLRRLQVKPHHLAPLWRLAELGHRARWATEPEKATLAKRTGYEQAIQRVKQVTKAFVDPEVEPMRLGKEAP